MIFSTTNPHIAKHFNLADNSVKDLKVQPIDQATDNTNTVIELYRLEVFWIKTLRTRTPKGLNVSALALLMCDVLRQVIIMINQKVTIYRVNTRGI